MPRPPPRNRAGPKPCRAPPVDESSAMARAIASPAPSAGGNAVAAEPGCDPDAASCTRGRAAARRRACRVHDAAHQRSRGVSTGHPGGTLGVMHEGSASRCVACGRRCTIEVRRVPGASRRTEVDSHADAETLRGARGRGEHLHRRTGRSRPRRRREQLAAVGTARDHRMLGLDAPRLVSRRRRRRGRPDPPHLAALDHLDAAALRGAREPAQTRPDRAAGDALPAATAKALAMRGAADPHRLRGRALRLCRQARRVLAEAVDDLRGARQCEMARFLVVALIASPASTARSRCSSRGEPTTKPPLRPLAPRGEPSASSSGDVNPPPAIA